MKLWILEVNWELPQEDNPFCWNAARGVVVRAESESEARRLAEQDRPLRGGYDREGVWLDPHYTRCQELSADGPPAVILTNTYGES